MTNHIQSPEVVVCIGNGSLECDVLTRAIALELQLPYHSVMSSDTECQRGIYHTSVYDIKLSQLKQKLQNQNAKVILLDIPVSAYSNTQDYAYTRLMFNTLAKTFPVEDRSLSNSQWIYQQLQTNTAFCVVPFVSVYQSSNGGSHCCRMPPLWQGPTPVFFTQRSIDIREKILQGHRVPECKKCYEIDDNHGHSDRKSMSYDLSSRLKLYSESDLAKNTKVKFVNLTLNNQCNLLCRMCGPSSSNLIAREYKELKLYDGQIESKQTQFDKIDIDSLQRLLVTGGEPTINSDFLEFLYSLPLEKQQTLEVLISTNAVILNDRIKALTKKIPNMQFSVSIDGLDELNHYIRWPSDWKKVAKNIEFIHSQGQLSNFKTTVSIYNINHLYELYSWIDTHYSNIPCGMNFVEQPDHLIPWNYPNRLEIETMLDKIKNLKLYQDNQEFQDSISYIQSKIHNWQFNKELLTKFFTFNDILDHKRQVSLKDYNKELDSYRSIE